MRQRKQPYAHKEGDPAGRGQSSHRRNVLRRRSRSPCWRGGLPFCHRAGVAASNIAWESDQLAAPSQSSKASVHKFFSNLTNNLTDQVFVKCCKSVQEGTFGWLPGQRSCCTANEPVRTLATQCATALNDEATSDFVIMLRLIQLVCRCSKYVLIISQSFMSLQPGLTTSSLRQSEPGLTNTNIWHTELETTTTVAKRTFLDWVATGNKFAFVAGGGKPCKTSLMSAEQ